MLKTIFVTLILTTFLSAKITVTASIYPIYSIVKEVGGDAVVAHNFIPFGIEPHHFEPTPASMTQLKKSTLFFYGGSVMEPWSPKVISSLGIQSVSIDLSQVVKTQPLANGKKVYDPHYWLSFDNYIAMVKHIENKLASVDTPNAVHYHANANAYIQKVKALQTRYNTELANCRNRKILVNHNAFGYVASAYNITQFSVSGMSPEDQPSAKQIATLIKLVRKENLNTVFFEEFASDKVAKTIAKEAGVKTDSLRPVENITADEHKKGFGYLDILEENLQKLKSAMVCR